MKKASRYAPFLLLALAIITAFAPLLINGGFIGDLGDPIGQTIPNKFLLVEYLKSGMLPLWNPFSFLGFPFLADMQVGAFYLPDILTFSILPPLVAHNFSVLLHLLFAGIGSYLFLKTTTKNKLLSLALSLVLVLGGAFITRIVYLNFLATISYIPWVLLALSVKETRVWVLAVLFALMFFAGHPVAFLYSLMIIGLFTLINQLKKWKHLAGGFFLGLLLASIQLLPFIELKQHSVRDALSYEQFIEGSLTVNELVGLFTPFSYDLGNPFDTYIHFGVVAAVVLLLSLFFVIKFKKKDLQLYLTGIALCLFGVLFSLGGEIPFIAETLYQLPGFNLIRVPARYMILCQFGAILSLAIFLKYIFAKNRNLGITISILLIINALVLPSSFLHQHQINELDTQYAPEISSSIQASTDTDFSLNTTPQYFLSSSYFLFPNRHILSLMPNVIGYNPLSLKSFHDVFPVSPVGAFDDPNYLTNYYQQFKEIGLNYYIFPSEAFLAARNIQGKTTVTNFLQNQGWQKIISETDYDVWQDLNAKEFAYFQNSNNKINKLNFSPGKIELTVDAATDDTLIVNQSYYPGWIAQSGNSHIEAQPHNGYLQAYAIKQGANEITINYKPKSFIYGLCATLLGLIILICLGIYEQKIPQKLRSLS